MRYLRGTCGLQMHASTVSDDAGRHGAHPTSDKGPAPRKDTKQSKVCIDSIHPTSPGILTKACGWHLVIMSNMLYAASNNTACIIPPTRCKNMHTIHSRAKPCYSFTHFPHDRYKVSARRCNPCSLYSSARMCRCPSASQIKGFSSYSCHLPKLKVNSHSSPSSVTL